MTNNSKTCYRKFTGWTTYGVHYFFCFWFLYSGYAIVYSMDDSSFVTQLRNVEWELFVLYREGAQVFKPELESQLWAEVDRLEGLLVCDNG